MRRGRSLHVENGSWRLYNRSESKAGRLTDYGWNRLRENACGVYRGFLPSSSDFIPHLGSRSYDQTIRENSIISHCGRLWHWSSKISLEANARQRWHGGSCIDEQTLMLASALQLADPAPVLSLAVLAVSISPCFLFCSRHDLASSIVPHMET